MCVICVSRKGFQQPDLDTLKTMFRNNPHGAGYMFARSGKVYIKKGFMKEHEFLKAVKAEEFTPNDVVVYHCRISTGAGVAPKYCHPYPLTNQLEDMFELSTECEIGVVHNGIIHQPDCEPNKYTDTQNFIANYLSWIFEDEDAIHDKSNRRLISELTEGSRLAILDGVGNLMLTGQWIDFEDLLFSNTSFLPRRSYWTYC